jgi:hypothetical protein
MITQKVALIGYLSNTLMFIKKNNGNIYDNIIMYLICSYVQCKNGKMIHSIMCCTFSAKHAYCRTTKQDKKKSGTNSKIKWKKYITLYIS